MDDFTPMDPNAHVETGTIEQRLYALEVNIREIQMVLARVEQLVSRDDATLAKDTTNITDTRRMVEEIRTVMDELVPFARQATALLDNPPMKFRLAGLGKKNGGSRTRLRPTSENGSGFEG